MAIKLLQWNYCDIIFEDPVQLNNNQIKILLLHSLPPYCFKFLLGQFLLPTSFPEANGRKVADLVLVNIVFFLSLLQTSHLLHCFKFLGGQVLLPSYPEASGRRWQTLYWWIIILTKKSPPPPSSSALLQVPPRAGPVALSPPEAGGREIGIFF
jgi:hypothetical protein